MSARPADTGRQTGLVTAIVIGTMAIGPFVNYVFSALAPFLVSRTRISSGDIGIIVTVIFGVATLTSGRAGMLSDQRGAIWSSKLLLWVAFASLLTTVIGDVIVVFLIGGVLAGFVHALSHPTTNALVSTNIPMGRQGLVVGLKQSGVQVGQFLAGIVLPLIAPIIGWRLAVSSGFVIICLALVGVHAIDRSPVPSARLASGRKGRLDKSVVWLGLYALILGISVQGTNVYLSLFAFEELHFTERAAGLIVGVVGGVGAIARIGWGVWAHRFTTMWRPLVMIAVLLLASTGLISFATTAGTATLAAGVALLAISATALSVLLSVALIHSSVQEEVGGNSGAVMRGLYAGYMAGPFLFGQTVERLGYPAAWGVMAVFSVVAALMAGTVLRRIGV